jgi:hypothetical protein
MASEAEARSRCTQEWNLTTSGGTPPQPHFQIHLPEAALYEDMCFHFNHAADLHQQIVPGFSPKTTIKAEATFNRAAVSASFYMVEAYCNGLAFDTLVRKGKKLSASQVEQLTEYDTSKGRSRYLKLRDKLVLYPMIATGAHSPLLDENTSPEFAYVVDKAKALRDAVVHASPVPQNEVHVAMKTRLFSELSFGDTSEVVDKSLELVARLAELVYHEEPFWLKRRSGDGKFGPESFT